MAKPFNKAAQGTALSIWDKAQSDDLLERASRLGKLLASDDMESYHEVRDVISELCEFAEGMWDATDTLGEEDE